MSLAESRREFFQNIWNHAADPFQLQFDVRRRLTEDEVQLLHVIAAQVKATSDDQELATHLKEHLNAHGEQLMSLLLQLTGLTRSKIITDMKAAGGHLKVPSRYSRLHLVPSWEKSGPYLAANVRRVFQYIPSPQELPANEAEGVEEETFEAINQATYPGYVRQERAKRQGHEAEYRLAVLMRNLNIPFVPVEKADNPLCPDQQIHGESFDLVVPNASNPVLVVKSTVHTANIGQYGESKDDLEVRGAKEMLRTQFTPETRPVLLALIDGIGFSSNRAGLDGVLTNADEFCQFSTLWKAAVVAADRLGMRIILTGEKDYFQRFSVFFDRYSSVLRTDGKSEKAVEAGAAFVEVVSP